MKKLLLSALSLGLLTPAFAWNDTGHMVIAAIAKRNMTARALSEAEWLLKQNSDDKSDNLLTASCWADDHRTKVSAPWHYINLHFRTDDKQVTNEPEKQNAVTAIANFTKILRNGTKTVQERAEALRYLIHFVGDLHQPLHAVARDSDEHPNGDRGGNDFPIKSPAAMEGLPFPPQNLHALWDSGAGLFPGTSRPLSADGLASINKFADTIRAAYPELTLDNVSLSDPMAWAQESADIAKRIAYDEDLKENAVPSSDYLRKARDASMKRCAYAGYRLAILLNKSLG